MTKPIRCELMGTDAVCDCDGEGAGSNRQGDHVRGMRVSTVTWSHGHRVSGEQIMLGPTPAHLMLEYSIQP